MIKHVPMGDLLLITILHPYFKTINSKFGDYEGFKNSVARKHLLVK